jgi:hypothetical protein
MRHGDLEIGESRAIAFYTTAFMQKIRLFPEISPQQRVSSNGSCIFTPNMCH